MKDKTLEIIEKHLDGDFITYPLAPNITTLKDIEDLEKTLQVKFPEEYVAHLLGEGAGGNYILQITQGKNRGKLAMLDHEVAGAMVDWADGDDELYDIPIQEADTDGLLNACFEYGVLTLYAMNFDTYFSELLSKHKALFTAVKK